MAAPKRRWRKTLALAGIIALLASLSALPASAQVEKGKAQAKAKPPTVSLQILAINDFHGHINTNGVFAGVPVGRADILATHIRNEEAGVRNSIVVSAGDLTGASPLISALFHDEPTIEAMNMIEYLTTQSPDATTIAIASSPGDYGEDSNAGAVMVAEALGLEVVYDGTGQIVATDPATLADVAGGIAGSGAELVWVTTDPTSFGGVYGQALAAGFSGALWSGAGPSWNPALIAPDSPIAEPLANDFYISQYYAPWAADSPGNQMVRDLVEAAGAPPLDYYAEGVIEAKIMHEALLAAYEAGDMTQTDLPRHVTLEITETEPVVKGQTASSSYKPAILSNGVRTLVPPHIQAGTRVVIATEDGSYVERAKD